MFQLCDSTTDCDEGGQETPISHPYISDCRLFFVDTIHSRCPWVVRSCDSVWCVGRSVTCYSGSTPNRVEGAPRLRSSQKSPQESRIEMIVYFTYP